MKLFFITNTIGEHGGSERMTKKLLEELLFRGHELFIFTSCNFRLAGAKTFVTKTFGHHAFHKAEMLFFAKKAIKLAKEFKPDIVHSHSNSLMGLIGHLIKKELGTPHVFSIEMLSPKTKSVHGKAIFLSEKFLMPKLNYDAITSWSDKPHKEYLIPWGIKKEKLFVIPPSVDLTDYGLDADPSEIRQKFGESLLTSLKTLAGLNTIALKEIIDAIPFIIEKHPEFRYVIFGDGPGKKTLENYVVQKNLSGHVFLPGAIDPKDCSKVWAATKIAPHAFAFDLTIGISFLEYMAFGVPCVATDVGDIKNLVGAAVIFAQPKNAADFAEKTIKLIEDKKMRKTLSEKSRRLVKDKFNLKKVGKQLEKIYEAVKK